MLESSFGLTFFLKSPQKKITTHRKTDIRYVYMRITVDGIPKETSTKRKWDANRWDQKTERAIGNKEDARVLNFFLDSMVMKVHQCKSDLIYNEQTITTQKIMDYVLGRIAPKAKVLEEFQLHNDEMLALVPKEYAKGTHERFVTARSHVGEFIKFKYHVDDMEFRELNYEFIKDYEFYLKTVRKCSNNTTLKYISNFKKIILRAIDKEIIVADPFKRFKGKKTKLMKKPLSMQQLTILENHQFSTPRLATVRDIFIFQCYTGLAYIDAFNLKKSDIKTGIDGEQWIISARQKTGSPINIPLLPKAVEIMEKYRHHPICLKRGSVLPVSSNQKMNEYLKEIADLCQLDCTLNTHKARRTFGSTVTLNNHVPIHVVKEMLGHHSVKQTEEYALTEEQAIGREMQELKNRLNKKEINNPDLSSDTILRLEAEIQELKKQLAKQNSDRSSFPNQYTSVA
ncbi:MAG: site-specific integrase [Bacteroidetes bacterium]|nr:site-specific integrase [Bacteroidota bacterium]